VDQQTGLHEDHEREKPKMQPPRQQRQEVEQREGKKAAHDDQRQPEGGPKGLEQDCRSGQEAAAGEAA
jgi:hypothetical protein